MGVAHTQFERRSFCRVNTFVSTPFRTPLHGQLKIYYLHLQAQFLQQIRL